MGFDLVSILCLLLTLGGSFALGMCWRQRFSHHLNGKLVLFEARTKVYSRIMSRVMNTIQEPDMSALSTPMKLAELNEIFSEVFVFAGPELAHLIQRFVLKEYEFRVELNKKNVQAAKQLHSELAAMAEQMHAQMRAELLAAPVQPEAPKKPVQNSRHPAAALKGRRSGAQPQQPSRPEVPPVPPHLQ